MFLNLSHWMNCHCLSWLVASIRFILVYTIFSQIPTKVYSNPAKVGYIGWIEAPWFGPLAFMRLDGSLQVRW